MSDDLRSTVARIEREMTASLAVTGTISNCGDVDAGNLVAAWADQLRAALKAERPKSFDELHDFVQERVNAGDSL